MHGRARGGTADPFGTARPRGPGRRARAACGSAQGGAGPGGDGHCRTGRAGAGGGHRASVALRRHRAVVGNGLNLAHLRPEVHELAQRPVVERLARRPVHRWIGYTRAVQAVARLERMLDCAPGRVRPRCLLVVGPTNSGKTAIAEHFLRGRSQHTSDDGERGVIPVLLVQMRPGPVMARTNRHIHGWLMTEEGRVALEEIRMSLRGYA